MPTHARLRSIFEAPEHTLAGLRKRLTLNTRRGGEPDACWEWTASVGSHGYGQIGVATAVFVTHRVAWELANGPIPDNLFVLHRCDNKRCVRLSHLFLGTAADNVRDAASKGRMPFGTWHWSQRMPEIVPRGMRNGHAKISDADVREIRLRALRGENHADIVKDYPIGRANCRDIVARRTWKHID